MTSFAIQAGALRTNPNSGPDGVGVQADVAYTLEARAEVQAVCTVEDKAVKARAEEPKGGQVNAANDNTVPFLSVCAGIEAASVAWHPLGWRACLLSEIEKFPRRVLAHHYPDTRLWGDFTALRVRHLRRMGLPLPSILVGGTPCQAFSVAGLRKSLADARGNLTLSFVRLAHALANAGSLRNAVWENVPGVLNTKDNAFGCFLGAIVGADDALPCPKGGSWPNAGMVAGPRARAAWRILDAQYFGLAQRRRRVFVVVDFGNGADPAAVLFEPVGVLGNSPPRRETGQGVAASTARSVALRGREGGATAELGDEVGGTLRAISGGGDKPHVLQQWPAEVAAALDTTIPKYRGLDNQHVNGGCSWFVPAQCITGDVTHTLRAEGFDASEDGTGRGSPIVAFQNHGSNVEVGGDISGTVLQNSDRASGSAPCIAFSAKDYGGDAMTDPAPTLRAGDHSGSHANAGVMPAVAFNTRQDPIHESDCAQPLGAKDNGNGVLISSAARRLTPRECERLQGFPEITREMIFEVCAEEKAGNASFAEQNFQVQNPALSEHADVHVLIDSERQRLRLLNQGKLIWSASSADQSNESPLLCPVEDFVQFVAHMMPCAVPVMRTGRVASRLNETRSFPQHSGREYAPLCGFATDALVSDAASLMTSMDECMRFITSRAGQSILTKERMLQTFGYSVLSAINGFIPTITSGKNSFVLKVEHRTSYTLLPGYDADGPRYKALGNSMAVPVMRWIGERIALHMPAANDNQKDVSHAA